MWFEQGKKWEFDDVKTESGNRSFTLPASFMAWLKEHRQAQLERRMRLGQDWYDYDLVFANEVGEPLTSSYIAIFGERSSGKLGCRKSERRCAI